MNLTAEKIQSNWEEFISNIETYIKGERKQVATILRNISEDMELPRQKVSCARYGSVWTYHVDVIEQFKDMYL